MNTPSLGRVAWFVGGLIVALILVQVSRCSFQAFERIELRRLEEQERRVKEQTDAALKSENNQLEHAMEEWERIEAASPMNAQLSAALAKVYAEYTRRVKGESRRVAVEWLDEQLTGKTPEQIIEAWGSK